MSVIKRAPKPRKWLRSDRYINREYSWLQFNSRVLAEAANESNPLLERLKFLAIFESNLDEFYMVRVSGLIEQDDSKLFELSVDGMTPGEQLKLISKTVRPMRQAADELLTTKLLPELGEQDIRILPFEELTPKQKKEQQEHFRREVFPLLTPLILHPNPTFPFISNRSLNLAVVLRDEHGTQRVARVKVPTVIKRLQRLSKRANHFLLAEDLIRQNLAELFPGVHIEGSYLFRVIRDADIEIRELEAGDLLDAIEQTIKRRRFGDPVCLEVQADMPPELRADLMKWLEVDESTTFDVKGLLDLEALYELAGIDKPALRFPRFTPQVVESLASARATFDTIRSGDVLVHHPFDSFRSIENFVRSAAIDPDVIGIKMTLYRVGSHSPIVESLLAAAEAGKQVAVLVELKARFDESNNLGWARALERAGVHVSFGFAELKTHCKLCMVVRREPDAIRTYAHIGTGNYNPQTALVYTDLGLLTVNEELTQDVAELFNVLTGFSRQRTYRRLLVAPMGLREGVIERIHREIKVHEKQGSGRIIFKLNALVDPGIVDALYEASEAGVKVELIVRGICSLRPGIEEMSSNIRVCSVVGRFLEHSRILYFENGGEPEVFIGSSDLMRRNLDRRIETLVPITKANLIGHIRENILERYLQDNTNSWSMQGDGTYIRVKAGDAKPFSVQSYLIEHPTTRLLYPQELSD